MASSGKKGKKTKGKTVPLTDFLQETPGGAPTLPIRKTTLNWADDVDDGCDQFDMRPKTNVVLPTAPKASRGLDEYRDKIPHNPPFNAYLSNLPYDVTEDEIADFFGDLKIMAMRIPKDDRPGEGSRLKGFGYVEFEDQDSLIGALSITDTNLKNRRIRIELATNSENDRRRGRMDMNRDRPERPEVESGDWRSGPRSDPVEQERKTGGFNRDRERERDNGAFDRSGMASAGGGGGGGGAGGGMGSWRDAERPSFREFDRDRGFQREQRDSNFGDRGRMNDRDERRGERSSFGPRRFEGGERGERGEREFTRSSIREDTGAEQRARPKLNLTPRTKPLEEEVVAPKEEKPVAAPAEPSKPSGASASSIFGSARPVDTSARERQIEDRLAKENEKAGEGGREVRRDGPRRDEDRGSTSPRRYSPRRRSPPRRYSPRRSSPRRYSPRRDSRDRRTSPRRDSRDRRTSPRRDSRDRRTSPRRDSRDRRTSPRRDSRERKYSPPRRHSRERRYSPRRDSHERRYSPERRHVSPRDSLERGDSPPPPPQRRFSPRRSSSGERGSSPERRGPRKLSDRRNSDDYARGSDRESPERRSSPERRKGSPVKNSHPRNEKEKKGQPKEKGDKSKKEPHDKLKEPDAVVVSNKYAFLEAEGDNSD